MFPRRYFPGRYFAPKYFPESQGGESAANVVEGLQYIAPMRRAHYRAG